jgi:hypothetical protein
MTRWPHLPVLGSAELPALHGGADRILWPGLITLVRRLPADHVVIGGVMVYLHGAVKQLAPKRVTRDVDVLFNLEVAPNSLQEAVKVLKQLDYAVDPASPAESTHRYRKTSGEIVDILAPAGLWPKRDLTTTPPGRTVEVFGGKDALEHQVLVEVHYDGQSTTVPVPDLPRALSMKCSAYGQEHRNRPAQAFNSRHLDDIAFLTSLIEDPDDVLTKVNPAALGDGFRPGWPRPSRLDGHIEPSHGPPRLADPSRAVMVAGTYPSSGSRRAILASRTPPSGRGLYPDGVRR